MKIQSEKWTGKKKKACTFGNFADAEKKEKKKRTGGSAQGQPS